MAYNVLIVDDSTVVRQVIARSLQLAEVDIGELHQAGNGADGLAVLQDQWIDLVFCDLSMPVMDGPTMIEKMQEDGLLQHIPVIIVTADGSRQRRAALQAKGVSGYIRKPFTPEDLRDVVSESMGVAQ